MKSEVRKNAVAYYSFFSATALITFFTNPLLVTHLGVSGFGAFKAAQKLLDVAGAADGRPGQVLKLLVARRLGKGDRTALSQAVSSAAATSALYILPLLAVSSLIVLFSSDLIKSDSAVPAYDVSACLAILALNLVLYPLLSIPDAVLTGSNRGYIATIIQGFWFVATNAAMVTCAMLGASIVALALVMLVGTILNAASSLAYTKLTTEWFRWKAPERSELSTFFGLSGWMLVWSIVEKFLLAGEIVLISALLGVEAVAKYVLATYATQLILSVVLLTASAAMPALGQMYSSDRKNATRYALILRDVVFSLSIVGACGLLIFNQSFVSLWVSGEMYVGSTANLLLCLSLVQVACIRFNAQTGDLALAIRGRAVVGIATTALTVALPVGAVAVWGARLDVIVAAILVARLPLLVFSALGARSVMAQGAISGNAPHLAASLGLLSVAYYLGTHHQIESWLQLVLIAPVVAAATLMILLATTRTDTREFVVKQARSLLKL